MSYLEAWRSEPVVAVEVRPGRSSYDKQAGCWKEFVDLRVVLAKPSWDDARYSEACVDEFPEEDWARVEELAAELATALDVPLSCCDRADRYLRSGSWIDAQGPAPERAWSVEWTATGYDEHGHLHRYEGVDQQPAQNQKLAAGITLRARMDELPRVTPMKSLHLTTRVTFQGEPKESGLRIPPQPAADLHWVRGQLAGNHPASSWLVGYTPLQAMRLLSAALGVELDEVESIGAWARKEKSNAWLNAHVTTLAIEHIKVWRPPFRLRRAVDEGRPLRPEMLACKAHGMGSVQMVLCLREALGISLMDAKRLTDVCCSSRRDAEFEAEVRAVLQR